MAQTLKGDITNGAYAELRISGLTVQPGPEDNATALRRLEGMANEFKTINICVGYNFEDEPNLSSSSGIPSAYKEAFELCLAVRLMSIFGKGATPDPILLQRQMGAFSNLSASTAPLTVTQPSNRMPRGSGNHRFGVRFDRFYHPVDTAPTSCKTNKMFVDDIQDFREHFDAYLVDSEEIDTYTIQADSALQIESESNETPDIAYRIKAIGGGSEQSTDANLKVKIVVTTTNGRVTTRIVYFQIMGVEIGI